MALLKRKRAGLGDAMDVVTRFVNACNRHDADGVYSCLHPDFDSIQPMYPSRNFRGADQVRRNWQAIFDAEPGFRLTVLRSAAMDDTIWLELHGAGEDAEVAGVFIMGIQGDRIRWARIYSALVEPVPAGMGEPPAGLREVPRTDQPAATGDGEVVEEALIAPVLDMDRGGRRRRRRRGAEGHDQAVGAEPDDAAATDAPETTATVAGDSDVTAVVSGDADMETAVVVQGDDDVAVVVQGDDDVADVVQGGDDVAADIQGGEDVAAVEGDADVAVVVDDADVAVVESDDEVAVVADAGADVTVIEGEDEVAIVVGADEEVVVVDAGPEADAAVAADEPAPEVLVAAPADDDAGPPTEAVDMVTVTTDEPEVTAEPEPPAPTADDEPRRGFFGRKRL